MNRAFQISRLVLTAAVLLSLGVRGFCPPAIAAGGNMKPHFVEKGGQTPMPEDPATVRDATWLRVKYPEYAGFKPRLAVVFPAKERPKGDDEEWKKQLDPQSRLFDKLIDRMSDDDEKPKSTLVDIDIDGLERLVRQALGATGQFTMVERLQTQTVLDEQDFGASRRVERKSAAKIGRIRGADYIVTAQVIETNREKEAKEISAGAGALTRRTLGIGSIGISGKVAFCRINVTITDAETGEIAADMTVDGTASSHGVQVGGGAIGVVGAGLFGGGGKASGKSDAAITDAVQVCVNKMAYFATEQLARVPWNGSVTSAADGRVIINAGRNIGLQEGAVLEVYSKGEEQIDADTGESLGFRKTRIGNVRVALVDEKFSECSIVQGCEGAKAGDSVRLVRGS